MVFLIHVVVQPSSLQEVATMSIPLYHKRPCQRCYHDGQSIALEEYPYQFLASASILPNCRRADTSALALKHSPSPVLRFYFNFHSMINPLTN